MEKENKYFVSGMRCDGCELMIEDGISKAGLGKAKASSEKGEVVIEHKGKTPDVKILNKMFSEEGYIFSDKPITDKKRGVELMKGAVLAMVIAGVFFLLDRSGFTGIASVNSGSSFVSFLLFGLIAGVSTCAALVGGLVLSLSDGRGKKGEDVNFIGRVRPHVEFNLGRLFSYGFFGILLGFIGEKMNISVAAPAIIVIMASLIMVAVGLKMLGVRMSILSFSAGKNFSKRIFGKADKLRKYTPAASGFLTFFLPCGFTIASQGAALASGSPLRGGLIMFFFALGTVPPLFAIGGSKAGLSGDRKKGAIFSLAAGFLLLIFSAYNVNNQLNVLGVGSLNDVFKGKVSAKEAESMGSESQVIRMEAYSYGYEPDHFTVKEGIPVRWEIKDMGTSGCTNAVIARDFFKERIPLYRGKTSVVEFTPKKPGKYKFSCWMGMIRGIIEVK